MPMTVCSLIRKPRGKEKTVSHPYIYIYIKHSPRNFEMMSLPNTNKSTHIYYVPLFSRFLDPSYLSPSAYQAMTAASIQTPFQFLLPGQ